MTDSKVGTIEAIALLVIAMLNNILLILPNHIIENSGSSALLNTIFICLVTALLWYIILKLMKPFLNQDILDIANFVGGKILKTVIGILFITYFILIACTQLRNFVEILKITYFEDIPTCLLLFVFMAIAFLVSRFDISTISRTNLIIVILMIFDLLFIFTNISNRFVPERIFPLWGYGVKQTLFYNLTNVFAFTGLSYLYFLHPLLKKPESFRKISFAGLIISSVFLILSIMTLLFTYADILSTNEIAPVFTLAKNLSLSRFFERPESLFLFAWVLTITSQLVIVLFLTSTTFTKITHLKDRKAILPTFSILMLFIAMIPKSMTDVRFMQNNIFQCLVIFLLYVFCPIVLILANRKYKKLHPKGKEVNTPNEPTS